MSATGESRRRHGMTLIEALVVVALLGLVTGIGFPALERALGVLAFRQAASALAANLAVARAESQRSGRPVRLRVAADGRSYGWTGVADRSLASGLALRLTAGRPVVFQPDGSAVPALLTLTGGARSFQLSIEAETGLARAPRAPLQAAPGGGTP